MNNTIRITPDYKISEAVHEMNGSTDVARVLTIEFGKNKVELNFCFGKLTEYRINNKRKRVR